MKEKTIKKGIAKRLFRVVMTFALVCSMVPFMPLKAQAEESWKKVTVEGKDYWVLDDASKIVDFSNALYTGCYCTCISSPSSRGELSWNTGDKTFNSFRACDHIKDTDPTVQEPIWSSDYCATGGKQYYYDTVIISKRSDIEGWFCTACNKKTFNYYGIPNPDFDACLAAGHWKLKHNHGDFSKNWTQGTAGHWHACGVENCDVTAENDISSHTADGYAYAAHSYDEYVAQDNVLTATCVCEKAITLTLSASSPNYSGKAATITVGTETEKEAWTNAKLTVPTTISYEKADGTALEAAPTTFGNYVAKVSPEGVTASAANTAKVSFTIEKSEAELLADAKAEATDAIDTEVGKDTDDIVLQAATTAKAAIDAAETVADVTKAKEAGITEIQRIKAANELDAAKKEATEAINAAVAKDDSENVEKAALDAKVAIDQAETVADVAKAKEAGVKAIQDAKKANEDAKALAEAQKAAKAVVEKINAIGTVEYSDASKAKIDDARKAYDALTDVQKKLVTANQLKVLTDAEASYDQLKKAATKPKSTNYENRDKKATIKVPEKYVQDGVTYKITKIEKNAFRGTYVKKIILPKTLTKIESQAFLADNKLTSLEINSKKLTVSKTAFKGVKKKTLSNLKVKVSKKMSKSDFKKLKANLVKQGLKAENIVRK